MLKALARIVAHHVCFPLFLGLHLLIIAPIIYGGIWVTERLEADQYLRVFGWGIRLFLILLFLSTFYVSFVMTKYFADDGYMFLDSFKAAWVNLWCSLSFLPLVGHWFERPPNPRDALSQDDDGEESGHGS